MIVENVKEAAKMLGVLKHNYVTEIFEYIQNGAVNVTELCEAFPDLAQPEISQALGKLRKVGVVQANRKGRFIYYSIDELGFKKLQENINALVNG